MATTFWLSMGYNFSCVIARRMIFDSRGWVLRIKLSHEDIAEIEVLTAVAVATTFWLSICQVLIDSTWRIRLNRPRVAAMEPCQITLTSCYYHHC